MRVFKIILVGILILMILAGIGLLFAPIRSLLPSEARTQVVAVLPDYFVGSRGGVVGTTDPQTGQPNTGSVQSEYVWSIPGQNGTTIQVTPFDGTSTTSPGSTATTPPNHDVVIAGNTKDTSSPYIISYYAKDNSFTISLLKEPIGETRKAAEAEFLARLGISQTSACNLRYVVLTPQWVNSFYAGKNLGFSFCPGVPQF